MSQGLQAAGTATATTSGIDGVAFGFAASAIRFVHGSSGGTTWLNITTTSGTTSTNAYTLAVSETLDVKTVHLGAQGTGWTGFSVTATTAAGVNVVKYIAYR
jgi:hypothetical protein